MKISLDGETKGTPKKAIRWANAAFSACVTLFGFGFWFGYKEAALTMLVIAFASKTFSNYWHEDDKNDRTN